MAEEPPKARRGGRAPPPPVTPAPPKPAPAAASASSAGASSATAAEIVAAAEASWDERSRERKKQLEALRQQEKDKLGKDQKKGAKDRLAYLMRQTDVFAHFMSPDATGASGGAAEKSKGAGRKGKGRLTEKQEDELMMQAASKEDKGKSVSGGTRLTKQPACITGGTMRPYQLEGLNWLIKLYENGINGILADEMGLGKTLQTISLLAYLKESCNVDGPHLVITPKSTISNWCKEVQRFCPSVRAFKFIGDKHERAKLKAAHLDFGTGFDVCITTYEVAITEKAALSKLVWRYLIIDEAHRIKNETSVLSQVVRMFSTHFRLLITGTPLQNNLHELWAMLNYLLPDIFDSSDQFDDWFSLDGGESKPEDVLSQLHKILRPFLLRRLKADVEKDLPPKREIKLLIGMSEMQRAWYASVLTKNIDVLNAMGGQRSQMHNILMHLRKCANHPYLFDGAEQPPFINDERIIKNSGKVILLDKLLQKLHPQGHRVLIFSQMTRMLDILEDYCWLRRWEYCRIDGSTSTADRDEAMETYNAPGSSKFIFMLSTRAGGLGINLATADTVVLYDSDWNPQMDLQAVDRAHRIGQTKPVMIYRFMTEGTVEEKIIERAQKKLYLDAAVIQQGRLAEQSKSLSKEEMLSMIRFGADAVFKAKDDGDMDYTDEDIDALLQRGEERTKADNERLEAQSNSLANFSLGGEEKSLYDFDGQDWSGLDGSKGSAWSLTLPKRKHKESYDENETYRRMVGEGRGPRGPKQSQLFDFQFFDTVRLEQLRQIELKHWEWKQERKDEQRARRRRSSLGDDDDDGGGGGDDDDEGGGPPKLTAEEAAERDDLMRRGFPDWQKKDLMAFVRGCEMYGRHDLASVALEVEGKSEKEVARYAVAFFQRFAEIKEWEKLMKRIEQGEAKLQKRLDLGSALAKKVARCKSPFVTMRIDYGSGGVKGKQYTEEEDRFLVCMTNQLGFGSWEELQQEVRAAWAFRFDWFIRTRTADELGQRVEALARLIEKEILELEAAERKKAKAAAGGSGAGGKRPAPTPLSGGKGKKAK